MAVALGKAIELVAVRLDLGGARFLGFAPHLASSGHGHVAAGDNSSDHDHVWARVRAPSPSRHLLIIVAT